MILPSEDLRAIKRLIRAEIVEGLRISIEQSEGNYGEKHCKIFLLLDGEVISQDSLYLDE